MIEISEDFARFYTTSQRLVDQVRTRIKKTWFSDLEIFEIHQQINRESSQQDSNTIIKILNTEKEESSDRTERQSNNNRKSQPNKNFKKLLKRL